jgi:hypothetical protein
MLRSVIGWLLVAAIVLGAADSTAGQRSRRSRIESVAAPVTEGSLAAYIHIDGAVGPNGAYLPQIDAYSPVSRSWMTTVSYTKRVSRYALEGGQSPAEASYSTSGMEGWEAVDLRNEVSPLASPSQTYALSAADFEYTYLPKDKNRFINLLSPSSRMQPGRMVVRVRGVASGVDDMVRTVELAGPNNTYGGGFSTGGLGSHRVFVRYINDTSAQAVMEFQFSHAAQDSIYGVITALARADGANGFVREYGTEQSPSSIVLGGGPSNTAETTLMVSGHLEYATLIGDSIAVKIKPHNAYGEVADQWLTSSPSGELAYFFESPVPSRPTDGTAIQAAYTLGDKTWNAVLNIMGSDAGVYPRARFYNARTGEIVDYGDPRITVTGAQAICASGSGGLSGDSIIIDYRLVTADGSVEGPLRTLIAVIP